jgi:membrane-bound ClpP family serine protease
MEQILSTEFTAYVALAVVLYAIRQAARIPNRYLPMIAIVLGVLFSWFEAGAFTFAIMMTGIQYALLGLGTVASIKYALEKNSRSEKEKKNWFRNI